MRWRRLLLAGGTVGLLLLPAAAAAEERHVGLHDMTCDGVTAMGRGMPKSAELTLTFLDQDSGRTLARQSVATSARGTFDARLRARLDQALHVRLLVTAPDGARVGFAEHAMAESGPMCELPFTGTRRGVALLVVGLAMASLGGLLLALTGHRAPPPTGGGPR